jgi:CHAD domain-containing protein
MGFGLKRKEKLAAGITRLAREQAATILQLIRTGEPIHPAALHEARKSVKRIRALLRMVRKTIPKETFDRENQFYREVGRALSPGRDAEVLVLTAKKLQKCGKKAAPAVRFLVRDLRNRRSLEFEAFASIRRRFEEPLRAAMTRIDLWNLGDLTCTDLELGARRAYKGGRKKLHQARKRPSGESLHAWRKQVKDLWYDLCVLKKLSRGDLSDRISEFKALSECIGEYHDLIMLNVVLKRGSFPQRYAELRPLVKKRRCGLQKSALKRGSRMYSEEPNTFAEKLKIVKRQ